MKSCLYEGQVRHQRFWPRPHRFDYRVFYVYLDLDELDTVFARRLFWSGTRPALAWFRRADYLGNRNIPLKQAVQDRVEQATGTRPQGPIRMLTHLRYFGLVFNPVTFYYCFDRNDDHIETIVAEITNTPWNERHAYVLPAAHSTGERGRLQFSMQKDFHVSPFMPMDMQYRWSFSSPNDALNVHMVNLKQDAVAFTATMALTRKPMTAANCASVLLRYPLMTLKVIAAIYWQALRLYAKRVPFFTHPDKREPKSTGGADSAKSL